ncbi:Degenerin mec-10 [Araneus ventricosus]|uniref:Degenerin mec-10 n=1 Tax=Araneus ventricosus TaxID=182803 RepID=A0A4Y2LJV6_ARAVE|nr:Degenerin mec-10 [Araneus ventricosus]
MENLEFPAVTVCNLNRIQPDNNGIHPETIGLIATPLLMSELISFHGCKMLQNGTNFQNKINGLASNFMKQYDTLNELRQEPSQFIDECSFNGKKCSLDYIKPLTHLRFGNCVTFNSRVTNAEPWRTSETGVKSGLILEIRLITDKGFSQTKGAKIVVHNTNDEPDPEESGYVISPGYETSISLRQTVFRRLPAPYKDNCIDYKSQNKLFIRSKNQCIRSCIQEQNIANCGCIDLTLENLKKIKPCDIMNETQSCCLNEVLLKMANHGTKCNCPLPCFSATYHEKLSRTRLISSALNTSIMFTTSILRDTIYQLEAYEQKVRINIFYSELERYVYEQQPKWTELQLLSYLGNELGVWLGLSLVIIFELFEKVLIILKSVVIAVHAKVFNLPQK